MKQSLRLFLATFVLAAMSGCVNTELIADVDPSADLTGLETFYVAKFGPDERGIENIIAAEMNAMGMQATAGASPTPPSPVDAVVTYQDKWMWDITMYMIELTIELREGRLPPSQLAKMDAKDMARDELKQKREEANQKELKRLEE